MICDSCKSRELGKQLGVILEFVGTDESLPASRGVYHRRRRQLSHGTSEGPAGDCRRTIDCPNGSHNRASCNRGRDCRFAGTLCWHRIARTLADRDMPAPKMVWDPVRTPLVGIVTALHATNMPWNLILACDLPYLTADWVDWLLARAMASRAQIVIPRNTRGLEPLAAVYRRECAAPLMDALGRGVRKVTDAIAECQMDELPESDWSKHDPVGRVLKNVNTPAEYEAARKALEI